MEFLKKSKSTYYLNVAKHEIRKLIDYMESCGECLQVLYNEKYKDFLISVVESGEEIIITEKSINLQLDEEEFDYFKERLNDTFMNQDFYPAELCERKLKKLDISIYVYIIE